MLKHSATRIIVTTKKLHFMEVYLPSIHLVLLPNKKIGGICQLRDNIERD